MDRGRKRRRDSEGDIAALQAEWEARLSKEGLGERVRSRQMRGKRGTPERAHAVSREILMEDRHLTLLTDHDVTRRPESDSEAILRAAPHDTPVRSLDASYELRERLLGALDQLENPEDSEIVTRVAFGGDSYGAVARDLGYSTHVPVERRYKAALRELEQILMDDEEIMAYLIGEE